MKVYQRQIVELSFRFPPDGKNLVHPCIVLSNDDINAEEEGFVAVVMTSQEKYRDDLYSFEITDSMLNKPIGKAFSAARIHLIGNFLHKDVITNRHAGTE